MGYDDSTSTVEGYYVHHNDIEAGLAESEANQVVGSAELRRQLGINKT